MTLRKTQKLAQELARDPSLALGERHVSRNVFRHLCAEADEMVTSGDGQSLRAASLCCRLAGRLTCRLTGRLTGRRCQIRPMPSEEWTLSFAQLAAALRLAGRLDHAERALAIAFDASPPELVGVLHCRRAWLRLYQQRPAEALEDARAGVRLTVGREHARALGILGVVLSHSGDQRAAILHFKQCLEQTRTEDEFRYDNALHNYATALSKGTREEAVHALEVCTNLQPKFKSRCQMQRAKTRWLEGLLHEKLGDPEKAWRTLEIARRSLVALKAAPEVAAIIADMARVAPQPFAVQHLCYEARKVIPGAHPLAEPLRGLAGASQEAIRELSVTLRQAAVALAPFPAL